MVTRTAAVTPQRVIDRLLRSAGEDAVLVGGQALGFWVQRHKLALPVGHASISADTDFLVGNGDRGAVERFASTLGGTAWYPSRRAITSLVGMAYFHIGDDEFVNVDVIDNVVGLTADAVRAHAVQVQVGKGALRVMHPLDVLRSRLANLYKLVEKQTPKGVMQLSMAIDVAREFLRVEAATLSPGQVARRSPIQGYVSAIEQMATEDAGRKVAERFKLHVADAIDPGMIPAGPFWTKRWPALRGLMSADYASRFSPPIE